MLVTSNSFTSATSMNFTILNPDSKSAALYQTSCNNLTQIITTSLYFTTTLKHIYPRWLQL